MLAGWWQAAMGNYKWEIAMGNYKWEIANGKLKMGNCNKKWEKVGRSKSSRVSKKTLSCSPNRKHRLFFVKNMSWILMQDIIIEMFYFLKHLKADCKGWCFAEAVEKMDGRGFLKSSGILVAALFSIGKIMLVLYLCCRRHVCCHNTIIDYNTIQHNYRLHSVVQCSTTQL